MRPHGVGHQRVHRLFGGDVAGDTGPAQLLGDRVCRVPVEVRDHHLRSMCDQFTGDLGADSLARTCHDSNLAVEQRHLDS